MGVMQHLTVSVSHTLGKIKAGGFLASDWPIHCSDLFSAQAAVLVHLVMAV